MGRSGKAATRTRRASEGEKPEGAGPRLRFGLVWTTGIRCSFSGTGHTGRSASREAAATGVAAAFVPAPPSGGEVVAEARKRKAFFEV